MHPAHHALRRPSFQPRHHTDVPRDGHMRKEANLLNDIANAAPQSNRLPLTGIASLDQHRPGIGHQHAVHELEQRRLAGAAAADERQHVARLDREIETVQHAGAAGPRERDGAKLDRSRHVDCDGTTRAQE